MADITEIIAKEAIEGIKNADKAISSFDDGIIKVIEHYKELAQTAGKKGVRALTEAQLEAAKAAKEQAKATQEAEKAAKKLIETEEKAAAKAAKLQLAKQAKENAAAERELAKETKKRESEERKAIATAEKLAKKEREHVEALNMEVNTVAKAERQLKALTIEKKNAITSYGKQSQTVKDLNARMQQNTEFIRQNGTAAEKQRMNIGNYASAFKGLGTAMLGALGVTAGLSGAIQAFKGIMNSTQATADAFERTIYGIREQGQYLGRAFATMDFSNFISNMKAAREEGERYFNTLDLIGDLTRANAIQQAGYDKEIAMLRIVAKNRANDLQTRESALKKIIALEELKLKENRDLTKQNIDNQLKNAAFQTKYSEQQIKDFVSNYKLYKDEIVAGQKLIDDITRKTQQDVPTQYGIQTVVDTKAREKAYQNLNKQQEKQLMLAVLEKRLTDDQRIAIEQFLVADEKAVTEMYQGKESLIRLENSLRNELIKNEKQEEKSAASAGKQATEMEKLTAKITELRDKIADSIKLTGSAPDGLIRELVGSESELNKIQDQVKNIADYITTVAQGTYGMFNANVTAIKGKGIGKGTLTPKATHAPFGASDPAKGFSSDELQNIALSGAQSISDALFSIISNADQAAFDNKISLLEKEKEEKLKNTKLTEKQKAKIEEEYRKKTAKLKEESFRKQKAGDIIQSIINTALAVTRALATGNAAEAAAALIAGGASTAVIAAQPVPQFDKGTLSTPSTFIAGEQRPEWMITPSGDVQLVTRPTMFKNMAGATVIGGAETERMMKSGVTPTASDIRPDIQQMRQEIVRAIRDKKELHISSSGQRITEREGNYYKTYFNRTIQWAGRKN